MRLKKVTNLHERSAGEGHQNHEKPRGNLRETPLHVSKGNDLRMSETETIRVACCHIHLPAWLWREGRRRDGRCLHMVQPLGTSLEGCRRRSEGR